MFDYLWRSICTSLGSLHFIGFLCAAEVAIQYPLLQQPIQETTRNIISPTAISGQIPASQPPPSQSGNWLGWGGDIYNNHWASSDAVMDSSNYKSLALACQKPYDAGVSAIPLVTDGIAYFPTWSGLLVALDYKTCHTIWETNITKIILEYKPLSEAQKLLTVPMSRTTPVIGEHGDEDVLYIGTLSHALLLALDKPTGKFRDALQLESHPLAVLTMSPTFYQGHLSTLR